MQNFILKILKFLFSHFLVLLSGITFFVLTSNVKAEWILLPDARHAQYRTYGLLFDQQSSALIRDGGKGLGGLGINFSALEISHWKWQPQLTAHASSNIVVRYSQRELYSETDDARVGFAINLKFTEKLRFSFIYTHQSGHLGDGGDPSLFGSNLGNEILNFRLIYDIEQTWRFGFGLKPNISSDPAMKIFGAEQFVEWFPWGASENLREFVPFLAAGLEQFGRDHVELTFNAQLGVVIGNHFLEKNSTALRFVLGYYNGVDPRMKYYEFKHLRDQFVYLGAMVDI